MSLGSLRFRGELVKILAMGLGEALRQRPVQRLVKNLCRRVSENPFRTLVENENSLIFVHADDGVLRQVDDVGEALLGGG